MRQMVHCKPHRHNIRWKWLKVWRKAVNCVRLSALIWRCASHSRSSASSANCGKQNNPPTDPPADAGKEHLVAVLHQQEVAGAFREVCFGFCPDIPPMNGSRRPRSRCSADTARTSASSGYKPCPEIHHRTVEALDALCRGDLFADVPQPFSTSFPRPAADSIAAGEHALHVAVENRIMLTERKG